MLRIEFHKMDDHNELNFAQNEEQFKRIVGLALKKADLGDRDILNPKVMATNEGFAAQFALSGWLGQQHVQKLFDAMQSMKLRISMD